MEHPIIQIKNAITALLKGIDPDTDVFYLSLIHISEPTRRS